LSAYRRAALCVVLAALLGGCGAVDLMPRHGKADYLAAQAGWTYRLIDAGEFDIASYASPPVAATDLLTVYIEGDGLAFIDARTISADPTPEDPLALRLALVAPQRPAVYLARPCQYTMPDHGRGCRPEEWSSRRYAPEIIDAMNRAVDAAKAAAGGPRIVLVGYSGGGAVAVLLAAHRADVAGIVTIGGDLDLEYWTKRDNLAPLVGSLDPKDVAEAVSALPQIHFAGARDDVVGPDVVRAYLARMRDTSRARLVTIDDFDHECCWVDAWPKLVQRPELKMIPGWGAH
jgi:pimeloyl-ACP methyl ester carboxylesterase